MEEWQNSETITLWIVIIALFLLLLILSIFLLVRMMFQKTIKTKVAQSKATLAHQKDLLENTIKIQEKERQRVAIDIHDALIGQLVSLKMQHENDPKNENISRSIEKTIEQARQISHDLCPPLLEYSSIESLLDDIVSAYSSKLKIEARYDNRTDISYTNELKIQLIRIVQEAFTNIIKHAEASEVRLDFRLTKGNIFMVLSDNGKGFDIYENKKGLGLKSIETRVQFLKGMYRFRSHKNTGTRFILLINKLRTYESDQISNH